MSSRPVYWMYAPVAPSGECLQGKGSPDWMLAKPWCRLFLAVIPSGLNLVVAAVLGDSLCVVSLLPCVADCCMLYTVCKVEWFVLTIIKRRLLLLFNQSINQFISSHTTDIHNLQNQSNENIHIMCNREYPRSLVLRLYGLPMY